MDSTFVKLVSAYAAGTAATAWLVGLVRHLPLPSYARSLLAFVIPVPVIAVALVIMNYGPGADAADNEQLSRSDLLQAACIGGLTWFAWSVLFLIWRALRARLDGDPVRDDEDD